ncbi:MAG TPA: hopanoid-associated sugar epimerase [Chloroflexota bacterium]|nr:hopanoid-associated sugar epimerase [Chloroflexota bacterium]
MRALVTGATGFIGGNLARELLDSGYRVRALARRGSDCRGLRGLDLEIAWGDLLDSDSLDRALEECDVLFHAAAAYSLWTPNPAIVYEINVGGTDRLLAAALKRGIQRVVYTSSESTLAVNGHGRPGGEDRPAALSDLAGHYKRSKLLAEEVALQFHRKGLPVVVVNPTTPVGAGDVRPTPTGQFVLDFINGKMPAFVDTGLNVVDVADVAKGHRLAMERGRAGERYLLGNRNMTFREILCTLAEMVGRPAPRWRIPLRLALAAAHVDELLSSRITGKPPRVPLAGVRAAHKYRHFDCSKSVRELGMPQTPVEEALSRAVKWFRENGYAREA